MAKTTAEGQPRLPFFNGSFGGLERLLGRKAPSQAFGEGIAHGL